MIEAVYFDPPRTLKVRSGDKPKKIANGRFETHSQSHIVYIDTRSVHNNADGRPDFVYRYLDADNNPRVLAYFSQAG